jgi:capsular polysaccharide biosynthesis protein
MSEDRPASAADPTADPTAGPAADPAPGPAFSRPSLAKTPEGAEVRESLDLDRYSRTVRRHIRSALAGGLIGILVGLGINLLTPPEYQSTAVVHAPAVPTKLIASLDPEVVPYRPRDQTRDTDAALLLAGSTLSRVARRLDNGTTPRELRQRIDISVPPNTRILHISYTAGDPAAAQRGAQAVADEFVRTREARLTARANRLTEALWKEREQLQHRMDAAKPQSDTEAELNEQLNTLDGYLATLAGEEGGTTVVRAADRPTSAVRNGDEIPPMSGVAVGVLGGLALGVLRERRKRVVFDRRDVFNATGRRTVDLANIAVELQVTMAQRVLVTGPASRAVLDIVAGGIRTGLDRVGALTCRVVPAYSAVSGNTIRAAMTADLVIVVAERGHSTLRDLRRIMHLLDRSNADAVLFLARGGTS